MDTEREFTNRWLLRLYAAQTDLIDAFGGCKRAVEKLAVSKSQVGRWYGGVDRDTIPLPLVLAMEGFCGQPIVSALMAEFNGRALEQPGEGSGLMACLSELNADLVETSSHMMVETVRAKADGNVTPNEAKQLRILSRRIGQRLAEIDDMLAGAEAGEPAGGEVIAPALFQKRCVMERGDSAGFGADCGPLAPYRFTVRCDRALNAAIEKASRAAGQSATAFVQAHFERILGGEPQFDFRGFQRALFARRCGVSLLAASIWAVMRRDAEAGRFAKPLTAIADELGLTHSTVTRAVADLVAAGALIQRRNAGGGRSAIYDLTEVA